MSGIFGLLLKQQDRIVQLQKALNLRGKPVEDATPQALDHWEEMEAQAGARGHYIREDAEWMLNNGQVQELTEIVKELNAEIAKRQPRVTEAAE